MLRRPCGPEVVDDSAGSVGGGPPDPAHPRHALLTALQPAHVWAHAVTEALTFTAGTKCGSRLFGKGWGGFSLVSHGNLCCV